MKPLDKTEKEELFAKVERMIFQLENSRSFPKEWQLSYFRKHRERFSKNLDFIRNYYPGGLLADVGSFPFHETYILQQLNIPVIGIDLIPDRNNEFLKKSGLQVLRCDIEQEHVPLEDESISFVLFNETFEHLRVNPIHALNEIHRILKPDGKFMLTTPNLYSLKNISRFLRGKGTGDPVQEFGKLQSMGHMGHIREYSKKEMYRFLDHCGFRVIDHQFIHFFLSGKKSRVIARPGYFILRPFRPYQVIICESK